MNYSVSFEAAAAVKAGQAVIAPLSETEDELVVLPTSWQPLARANAVCQLRHGHKPGMLAMLALLVTDSNVKLAGDLLEAGWCPGEAFQAPRE